MGSKVEEQAVPDTGMSLKCTSVVSGPGSAQVPASLLHFVLWA